MHPLLTYLYLIMYQYYDDQLLKSVNVINWMLCIVTEYLEVDDFILMNETTSCCDKQGISATVLLYGVNFIYGKSYAL